MRAVFEDFYVGVRTIADNFNITETDPEGVLSNGSITGSNDGLNAGAGILLNYDSRDNYFESHSGWYAEFTVDRHGKYLGSDFDYTRFRMDVRKFLEFSPKDHIGFNFFSESIQGDAPFISLALIGGTKRMRGFYEGRYRDDNSAIFQAEYRRQLIGRFGAVAFAGTGAVANQYNDLSVGQARIAYGAGLRFALSPEDRINIRFDVGFTEEQTAFYLTIGESF
jgi:outer membrane protein assembly factor BamA